MSTRSIRSVARTAGVLILGTLGLHQLNYLLLHGDQAGAALAREGHGYLDSLLPALVAIAIALLFASIAVASLSPRGLRAAAPRESQAAILALAFLALFASQELIEGALVSGHPHGLEALAHSWLALPLAFPVGALAAFALGGLERTEQLLARAISGPHRARLSARSIGGRMRVHSGVSLLSLPLAFGLARRGPPGIVGR